MIVSSQEMTFYDIKQFMTQNAGLLVKHKDNFWNTVVLPDGVYWTGTKIACSTQVVARFKNGQKTFEHYDKTFGARVVLV